MLTTIDDLTPDRLQADDQVPGRGIVTTTIPHGDHVIVQVGKDFAVTGTQTGRPGDGHGGHGGPGHGDGDGDGPGAPPAA